ncbi:PilZ domain-containing protein [Pseudomonas sp. HK3]
MISAQNAQKIDEISSQQLSRFTQLESAMEGLLETLEQNTSKVANTNNIAESLLTLTQTLSELINHFKIKKSDVIDINEPEEDDRREHRRIQSHFLVRVEIDDVWEDAYCENISFTGMKILLNREIESDDNVDISLMLPKEDLQEYRNQAPMRLKARVQHMRNEKDGFVYGMQFRNMSDEQTQMLKQAIDFIEMT